MNSKIIAPKLKPLALIENLLIKKTNSTSKKLKNITKQELLKND